MYDDWGNEIAISPMAYPPPNDGLALDARTWAALYPGDVPSDESWTVGPANEAPIVPFSDDPFVIPSTDGPAPFKAKPGSVEDWLTPLSNDEADLGEIVVPGTRPPTPGEYYDGHGDTWSPSHDTDYRGDSSGDPPPEQDPFNSSLQADNPEGGDYKVPPNFNINDLIAAGNTIASIQPDGAGLRIIQFKEFVGPGQEFDFKSQTDERETYVQADGSIGTRSIYDAIGNWAYGFIAEIANIQFSSFYAWLNEQFDGDGVGEDPIDQMHIKAGYEAAKNYKETGERPEERNVYCGG